VLRAIWVQITKLCRVYITELNSFSSKMSRLLCSTETELSDVQKKLSIFISFVYCQSFKLGYELEETITTLKEILLSLYMWSNQNYSLDSLCSY